jgi:hypothetical protein
MNTSLLSNTLWCPHGGVWPLGWSWRKHDPQKHQHRAKILHGSMTHNTAIWTFNFCSLLMLFECQMLKTVIKGKAAFTNCKTFECTLILPTCRVLYAWEFCAYLTPERKQPRRSQWKSQKVKDNWHEQSGWSDSTYLSQQRTYLLNRLHSKSLDLQKPVFIHIYGLSHVFSTFSRPQTTFKLHRQLTDWEDISAKGLTEMK